MTGPPEPLSHTLPEVLGISGYERDGDDSASARMAVTDAVRQPFGIVHGGAYASLAETICSRATYEVVGPELGAFAQVNETAFLRPVSAGTVHAAARARHIGKTSWVWDVEMTDDQGRLSALSRVVIAVRPIRA